MFRYTAQVPQHVPKIKLGAYIRRVFYLLPESEIRNAFAKKDVKMDGVRCGKDEFVKPGSEVMVFSPYKMQVPVAFENEYILAIDKPAGVSCDQDAYGSMTVQDIAEFYAAGQYQPRMCHRLDNQTSGLVVLAKDEQTELALKQMFSDHTGKKEYRCIVCGTPKPASANCQAWLVKEAKKAQVKVYGQQVKNSKRIQTEYNVLRKGETSLLQIILHTGRTHQIRAHMAFLGYPVLGDDLYGNWQYNRKYGNGKLMLRSVALQIDTAGKMPQLDGLEIRLDDNME